jgi:phytoene/squalene synthetase
LTALISIYSRLLDRIERSNYDVFTRRISLSAWEKSWIVVRALLVGQALPPANPPAIP